MRWILFYGGLSSEIYTTFYGFVNVGLNTGFFTVELCTLFMLGLVFAKPPFITFAFKLAFTFS
jgi:hypothetical protein